MRNQFYFRVQRQEWRNTISGRRGVAKIAGYRAAILYLDSADLARSGLQSVKASRQWSFYNFCPGSQAADSKVLRIANHASEFAQTGNINHGSANRPISQRREKVGAARQDLPAGVGKRVYGVGERVGPEIQGMPSRMKSRTFWQEHNSSTNSGVCTGLQVSMRTK